MHELEGEVERAPPAPSAASRCRRRRRRRARSRGATAPVRSSVTDAGHADEHDRAAGRDDAQRLRRATPSLPTQSTTTSAPPVSCVAVAPATRSARRTARPARRARTTRSAPRSAGQRALLRVLGGGDDQRLRRAACARAAMRQQARACRRRARRRPSPSVDGARSAAWTAQAVGSTITAASSVRSSGTACSWLLVGDHERATSRRRCRSRSRSAAPARGGRRRALAAAEVAAGARRADGVDAAGDAAEHRLEHDAACRRRVSPTTSWPGTNGNETIGLEVARRPCRRRSRGRCRRCRPGGAARAPSPGPGRSGGSMSSRRERADAGAAARRHRARPRGRRRSGRPCARSAAPSSAALPIVRPSTGRDAAGDGMRADRAAAAAARPAPSTSARPASPACGRSRPAGSRG